MHSTLSNTMFYCKISLITVFLLSNHILQSQDTKLSNIENHRFQLTKDTTIYTPKTIIAESFKIEPAIEYTLGSDFIHIKGKNEAELVSVSYRTLALKLKENIPRIDSTTMNSIERATPIATDYSQEVYNNRRLIQSNKLEYSGSFSRGVSFGNAQDVVLNSNFNLQMKGDLGNGLQVRAAISDENIPIQPEGNTQVLQEFDKIFIEVQKDNTSVIVGDYELRKPNSHFMNYFKRLKGVSVQSHNTIKGEWKTFNKGSFAVSRGKFRRQNLRTSEGNQGPYRLEGENGELFFQVLSGTEKVYADGRLLTRGENNDYIIDYNRAEISFTSQLIITANLRIIVEFEYAVQSYLRSLYATESVIENEKWRFGINIYNEQDSKSLASNLVLSDADLDSLRTGGDGDIFRSGIFIPDQDALENITPYTLNSNILNYAPDATENVYGAVFTNFSENNGSYDIDSVSGTNGRVYTYVGEGNGKYDPLIQLVAPEKKQLVTFSSLHNFSDSTHVYLETALSNNDLNRFSNINNDDNVGLAAKANFTDLRSIGKTAKYSLQTSLDYEITDANFKALNPYRDPEFFRDWNLQANQKFNQQDLYSASIKVSDKLNFLRYSYGGYSNQNLYDGQKHIAELNILNDSWSLNAIGNFLNSTSTVEKTNFFRPRITAKKNLFGKKWTIGFYLEKEKNIREEIGSNNLNPLSFNYDLYRYSIESSAYKNLKLKWAISNRIDDRVENGELTQVTESINYEFGGNWKHSTNSVLDWQLVLRDFKVDPIYSGTEKNNKVFIGKIDHKLKLWDKALILNSYFEANSGQEPKVEFQYIKVQDGEGSYQWIDFNQDSIEQINEFVIANFSDQGGYEKITVFNNEFISTNRNVLNQSLKFAPKKLLENKKGFLSKIILSSRYRIDQKTLNEGSDTDLIRFINTNFEDTSLVASNYSLDHNVFFNRGNPGYDLQLSYRSLNNKFSQITGTENRFNNQYYSRVRVNIKRKFDALVEAAIGEKNYDSQRFDEQDFNIDFWNIIPQLNYRPSPKLRFILKYKIEKNQNTTLGSEDIFSNAQDIGLELTWRQNTNSNLLLRFNYVLIEFEGMRNTPVEFEMLQGLRDGNNLLWSLNYTKRISGNIDLILNYNGRKAGDSRLVNTAGVQMRALF